MSDLPIKRRKNKLNNNDQKKADFSGFVFKKDDEPNMFDRANQAANSQMPAAAFMDFRV